MGCPPLAVSQAQGETAKTAKTNDGYSIRGSTTQPVDGLLLAAQGVCVSGVRDTLYSGSTMVYICVYIRSALLL